MKHECGKFEGMAYANIPNWIASLCWHPEGRVDVVMWDALHTYLPLDEAYDLREIRDVGISWRRAHHANASG